MTGQEMATAKQYGANIIRSVTTTRVIIRFACIRRPSTPAVSMVSGLQNPDFAVMGESYGALGIEVTRDEEFLPAFKKALEADRSALIEVQTDYEYVTPSATLSELEGNKLEESAINNRSTRQSRKPKIGISRREGRSFAKGKQFRTWRSWRLGARNIRMRESSTPGQQSVMRFCCPGVEDSLIRIFLAPRRQEHQVRNCFPFASFCAFARVNCQLCRAAVVYR